MKLELYDFVVICSKKKLKHAKLKPIPTIMQVVEETENNCENTVYRVGNITVDEYGNIIVDECGNIIDAECGNIYDKYIRKANKIDFEQYFESMDKRLILKDIKDIEFDTLSIDKLKKIHTFLDSIELIYDEDFE